MTKQYTLQIEPRIDGSVQWQILDPRGNPWAWGARIGTPDDAKRHLRKTLDRINSHVTKNGKRHMARPIKMI